MIVHLGALPLLGNGKACQLIACDHCGQVALNTPRFGWKRWTDTCWRHHCPAAVQWNELLGNEENLRMFVDSGTAKNAVVYEDWDE